MRKRLRKLLYSAIPEEDATEFVLSPTKPFGYVRWMVKDLRLTWTVHSITGDLDGGAAGGDSIGGGSVDMETTVDGSLYLPNGSFATINTALTAAGIVVSNFASDFAALNGALVLDGAGDSRNGDSINFSRAPLHALLTAFAVVLARADSDRPIGIDELSLAMADSWWLNYIGNFYGVPRRGEIDGLYAPRIVREVFRARDNGPAIENAVLDGLGLHVDIYEPWRNIFLLDRSTLSGPDFLESDYYGRCIIVPIVRDPYITPAQYAAVDAMVFRNKAAGIIAYPARADATVQYLVPATSTIPVAARQGFQVYNLPATVALSAAPVSRGRSHYYRLFPLDRRTWADGGWDGLAWSDDSPVDRTPIYRTREYTGSEGSMGGDSIGAGPIGG